MPTTISGTNGVSQCAPGSVSQEDLQTGVTSKGPVFRAQQSSSQAITPSAQTKVVLANEVYDTANCYDPANSRFTPNVAGYYRFSGSIRFTIGSGVATMFVHIYKNGAQQTVACSASAATFTAPSVTDLIFMNGTTDYVELWGMCNGTTPAFDFATVAACASFCGELVRAA